MTHGLERGKPGPRAAKPITPPYVENNYRIEVKITFMLVAYLVLLCEFFWEFSIFHFCRPLVDIYWHPLLIVYISLHSELLFSWRKAHSNSQRPSGILSSVKGAASNISMWVKSLATPLICECLWTFNYAKAFGHIEAGGSWQNSRTLTLQSVRMISVKFLLVILMVCKAERSWELRTWSHKMNYYVLDGGAPTRAKRAWDRAPYS